MEDNITEIKPIKPKYKEETCEILWVKKDRFAISFKNLGITIDGNIDNSKKVVTIKYEGEIGKSNFKIVSFN